MASHYFWPWFGDADAALLGAGGRAARRRSGPARPRSADAARRLPPGAPCSEGRAASSGGPLPWAVPASSLRVLVSPRPPGLAQRLEPAVRRPAR